MRILRSTRFDKWLAELRDSNGKARILARLLGTQLGNLGDCKPVGEGVLEMRIHSGPGYRVYFLQEGDALIILLCGGDKSTQNRDIERALKMARDRRIGL